MLQTSTITQILTVPGLDASISVGLTLNGEYIAWGECILPSDDSLTQNDTLATLEQTVIPALQDQILTDFRALAEKIDSLTEEVTVSQPAPPLPDTRVQNPSRRNLFSGKLWSPPEPPSTQDVIVERAIHPAIRYGVSQALLAAVSIARNVTMAEVLAEEYKLPLSKTPIPIHVELNETNAIHIAPLLPAASLGYTTPGDDIETELGANGEILQRAIRTLQKRLTTAARGGNFPAIHVNARGGLGKLYNNVGKILGAIFGLTKAASPCSLRIEDPVRREDRQTHLEAMREVKEYLRLRRMTTPLVAGAWINSPDDVLAFAEADAADMIRLNMPRLGSLHRSIETALVAKQRNIAILLDAGPAETTLTAQIAGHVALALQPDLVSAAQPLLIYNEMACTLTWIATRKPLN